MPEPDITDELLAKYRPLVAEVFKLLVEMTAEAKAHGFDVSPYLQRLSELNTCKSSGASSAHEVPECRH